ncbi:MAG: FAD-dependent monooxygenase, partial [Thermoanaerobaculia bacterium]|nr:FAD-dependent monooxygenase [Thermoanaerobaculia bacterium]
SARGATRDALSDYDGWHPQIRGLIEATGEPFVTRLYDREALPSWVEGRAVLMGDAAHAMLPYHAQGAVQSLEDAWVLGRCLALGGADVDAALARYETLRRPRATEVQAQSRAAQDWYHYSDADDLARREARFEGHRRAGAHTFSPQQQWLYSYDAERAVLGTDEAWRRSAWRSV